MVCVYKNLDILSHALQQDKISTVALTKSENKMKPDPGWCEAEHGGVMDWMLMSSLRCERTAGLGAQTPFHVGRAL